MKDDIKRVAQFLFDNAELIAQELARSDSFRDVKVEFSHFKHGGGTKRSKLRFYDEIVGTNELKDAQITISRFEQLCCQMNEAVGAVPLPEQAEIRDSLG